MSNLQDKMYKFEAAPPAHVWEAVTTALDESLLGQPFTATLENAAIPPPAAVWNNINTVLDESLLTHEFSAVLHDMAVVPPAGSWQKISESLGGEATEKVIPLQRKTPVFFRYAAAAVLIGALAWGIIRFSSSNSDTADNIAETGNATDTNTKGNNVLVSPTPKTTEELVLNNDDKALEESKKMVAKLDRTPADAIKKINKRSIASEEETISEPVYAFDDYVPDVASRYIMLMTPDGGLMRMSKKWSDLLCCVAGESQDADCKDQLKKWQEKIASSPIAPSPGNFMDILSLVNSLNEDTEL